MLRERVSNNLFVWFVPENGTSQLVLDACYYIDANLFTFVDPNTSDLAGLKDKVDEEVELTDIHITNLTAYLDSLATLDPYYAFLELEQFNSGLNSLSEQYNTDAQVSQKCIIWV